MKIMKGLLYTILILLGLACVCIVTCPDKDAHSDALKELFNSVLTEKLNEDVTDEDEQAYAMFRSMLGTGLAGLVIDNMLKVENYFVCSIGTITYENETNIVSVGILNHVFTASEEDVKENAKDLF